MQNKFVLTEKFQLSEKFLLAEALNFSDFHSRLSDLVSFVKLCLKDLTNILINDTKLDAAEKIKTRTASFITEINNLKDPLTIAGKIKDYFSAIDKYLKIIDPFYKTGPVGKNALRNILQTLLDSVNNVKDQASEVKKLQDQINTVNLFFNDFKKNYTAISADSQTDISAEDITNRLKTLAILLAAIEKAYPDSAYDALLDPLKDDLSNSIEVLSDSMDIYNSAASANKEEKFHDFLELVENENKKLRKIVDQEQTKVDADEVNKDLNTDTDWDTLYKKSADEEAFWLKYYSAAWGKDGEKIKALGDAFKQECKKLGFNQITNPFIAFLKNYLNVFPITQLSYNLIHNAVADKNLKIKLLSTSPTKTEFAPIFCTDFYEQISNGKQYILVFKDIGTLSPNALLEDGAADKIEDTEQADQFKHITSYLNKTDRSIKQFIWLILFNIKPLTQLLTVDAGSGDIINIGSITPAKIKNAKLRALPEIEKILDILDIQETRNTTTEFDATTLSALIDEIKAAGGEHDGAPMWIRILATEFLDPDKADTEVFSKYPKVNSAYCSAMEESAIRHKIFGWATKMTVAQLKYVISKVVATIPLS